MRTVNRGTGEILLDQLSTLQTRPKMCPYGAPLCAIKTDEKASIYQACCNHWNCPVCWRTMAGKVAARMVHGARILADEGHALFFWTFTCRGRDLDLETADDNYYSWTNKALTNLRQQAKREGKFWAYVQVTERQKRGAAHSHFIHTFAPCDSQEFQDERGRIALKSQHYLDAIVAAGLGAQCQITKVETPEAVALYISGYLQKHAHEDEFPAGWKRVRWSRAWPDLPEQIAQFSAVLIDRAAFERADEQHVQFVADSDTIYEYSRRRMINVTRPGFVHSD